MFYQIRYQTGELEDVTAAMKKNEIPCMDVIDHQEFEWVLKQLEVKGIYAVEGLPYDKNARDVIAEPEFEFRAGFYTRPVKAGEIDPKELMYIDFYFEPFIDETYDNCGEM